MKNNNGITLIALIITIVILIILATVAINAVFRDGGLVYQAEKAKDLAKNSIARENEDMNKLEQELANLMKDDDEIPEQETSEVEEAISNRTEYTNTTPITDKFNNTIYIPGGFKLAEDSGKTVEEGIVIEDERGNQFVWIPVGEYNVTEEVEKITEPDEQDGKIINELMRRVFREDGFIPVNGDDAIGDFFGEGDFEISIGEFKYSVTLNKGFYIGRYEQGVDNMCKAGVEVFQVSKDDAMDLSKEIYADNIYIKSNLISSYAWDTALNYICQTNKEGYLLSTTTDSKYGNIETGDFMNTGEYTADNYSNIHDLLGNSAECTTEMCDSDILGSLGEILGPLGTYRGGSHQGGYASYRYYVKPNDVYGFRVQLYISVE